jgi:hypothetical protein
MPIRYVESDGSEGWRDVSRSEYLDNRLYFESMDYLMFRMKILDHLDSKTAGDMAELGEIESLLKKRMGR